MSVKLPIENMNLVENEFFTDQEFSEFLLTFQDKYNQLVRVINKRDYGCYDTVETFNGQTRFNRSDAQKYHDVYRKVVDFGILPDTALKQVAHGIVITVNTEMTRIYATATRPGVSFITIDPIWMTVDATNINITTPDDKTAYTKCTVILEYMEE